MDYFPTLKFLEKLIWNSFFKGEEKKEQIFENCSLNSSIFLQFLKPSKEFFARIFLHYEEKLSEFIHFDTYFPKKVFTLK